MKNLLKIITVCLLSSAFTLVGYHFFINKTDEVINKKNEKYTRGLTSSLNGIDFTDAAEQTVNSVVHVKNVAYQRRSVSIIDYMFGYRQQKPKLQVGTGSGVIISEDGYIVTNNHVIANASEIEITLNNNKTYKAQLIGTDKKMDIALLKITTDELLPYTNFGDSDSIKIGEWVLAVGNPYNLTSTVTAGIISAKARNLSSNSIQSFIQTDAVVNPGNSGGALVNIKGDLIGINTMISSNTGSYVGYSFAVPSNTVKKIIHDLRNYGKVQKGLLGITGIALTPNIASQLNLPANQTGFYIQQTLNNSDARKANLKQGDIIVALDDKKIRSYNDLQTLLATKSPNDIVDVTFIRDQNIKKVNIQLIGENN